jgi:hypothetical protein
VLYVCGGSHVAAVQGRSAPSDSRFGTTCVTRILQTSCAGEIVASMIRGKERTTLHFMVRHVVRHENNIECSQLCAPLA